MRQKNGGRVQALEPQTSLAMMGLDCGIVKLILSHYKGIKESPTNRRWSQGLAVQIVGRRATTRM